MKPIRTNKQFKCTHCGAMTISTNPPGIIQCLSCEEVGTFVRVFPQIITKESEKRP